MLIRQQTEKVLKPSLNYPLNKWEFLQSSFCFNDMYAYLYSTNMHYTITHKCAINGPVSITIVAIISIKVMTEILCCDIAC